MPSGAAILSKLGYGVAYGGVVAAKGVGKAAVIYADAAAHGLGFRTSGLGQLGNKLQNKLIHKLSQGHESDNSSDGTLSRSSRRESSSPQDALRVEAIRQRVESIDRKVGDHTTLLGSLLAASQQTTAELPPSTSAVDIGAGLGSLLDLLKSAVKGAWKSAVRWGPALARLAFSPVGIGLGAGLYLGNKFVNTEEFKRREKENFDKHHDADGKKIRSERDTNGYRKTGGSRLLDSLSSIFGGYSAETKRLREKKKGSQHPAADLLAKGMTPISFSDNEIKVGEIIYEGKEIIFSAKSINMGSATSGGGAAGSIQQTGTTRGPSSASAPGGFSSPSQLPGQSQLSAAPSSQQSEASAGASAGASDSSDGSGGGGDSSPEGSADATKVEQPASGSGAGSGFAPDATPSGEGAPASFAERFDASKAKGSLPGSSATPPPAPAANDDDEKMAAENKAGIGNGTNPESGGESPAGPVPAVGTTSPLDTNTTQDQKQGIPLSTPENTNSTPGTITKVPKDTFDDKTLDDKNAKWFGKQSDSSYDRLFGVGEKGGAAGPSARVASNDASYLPDAVRAAPLVKPPLPAAEALTNAIGRTETYSGEGPWSDKARKESYDDRLNQPSNNANVRRYGPDGADYGAYQNNALQVKEAIRLGMDPSKAAHLNGGGAGGTSTLEEQRGAMSEFLELKHPKLIDKIKAGDLEGVRAAGQGTWFGLKDKPSEALQELGRSVDPQSPYKLAPDKEREIPSSAKRDVPNETVSENLKENVNPASLNNRRSEDSSVPAETTSRDLQKNADAGSTFTRQEES